MNTHPSSSYAEKRVIVIGAGVSGQAATRLLLHLGAQVTVIDEKPEATNPDFLAFMRENKVTFIGEYLSSAHFENCDVVVASPGVPYTRLAHLVHQSPTDLAQPQKPEIVAETDLALQFTTAPVIAITGTSGKTTTVSLCEAMLNAAGKKVFLGGNIGTPLSELVLSGDNVDVIILELSSFQLQGCKHLHAKVAAILNLNPNHLDQHRDMEEYATAKFTIFDNQTDADYAFLPQNLFAEYQRRGCQAVLNEIASTMHFETDFLQGQHNAINAETAFKVTRFFGVTEELARSVAKNFKPLAHRLEHVDTVNGVDFINDSKSTTVDSLRVALQSFEKGIILMAGGKFKGGDLHSLLPLLHDKVKGIALYGGSRSIFEEAWCGGQSHSQPAMQADIQAKTQLRNQGNSHPQSPHNVPPLVWHETMDEAFNWAVAQSSAGDVVLLSPATASYDQFPNYLERGKHFCQLVKRLA